MDGELQPRSLYEGEVGSEEERLEADDHGDAGGGDLAADSVEVACREVARESPTQKRECRTEISPTLLTARKESL